MFLPFFNAPPAFRARLDEIIRIYRHPKRVPIWMFSRFEEGHFPSIWFLKIFPQIRRFWQYWLAKVLQKFDNSLLIPVKATYIWSHDSSKPSQRNILKRIFIFSTVKKMIKKELKLTKKNLTKENCGADRSQPNTINQKSDFLANFRIHKEGRTCKRRNHGWKCSHISEVTSS